MLENFWMEGKIIYKILYYYKMIGDQKVPYLQGGLIFKEHTHD
jgi:hypothetical protein